MKGDKGRLRGYSLDGVAARIKVKFQIPIRHSAWRTKLQTNSKFQTTNSKLLPLEIVASRE